MKYSLTSLLLITSFLSLYAASTTPPPGGFMAPADSPSDEGTPEPNGSAGASLGYQPWQSPLPSAGTPTPVVIRGIEEVSSIADLASALADSLRDGDTTKARAGVAQIREQAVRLEGMLPEEGSASSRPVTMAPHWSPPASDDGAGGAGSGEVTLGEMRSMRRHREGGPLIGQLEGIPMSEEARGLLEAFKAAFLT